MAPPGIRGRGTSIPANKITAAKCVAGPLFVMMIQYCRTLKRMGRTESVFKNPNFQMAGVIFLLGIILLVTLIGDIIQL